MLYISKDESSLLNEKESQKDLLKSEHPVQDKPGTSETDLEKIEGN
jgi:hypothetical protein